MRITTVINRCKKSDFKAFEKMSDNIYKLRWGYKAEVEHVSVRNEETGEVEFTGEVKETDWCTFESILYRNILTPYLLDLNILSKAQRHPSINELHDIYEGLGVSQEEQVVLLKQKLIDVVVLYDSSSNVNSFTIGGVSTWLDKATRVGLKLRFEAEKRLGKTETTLWQNGMQFPLPLVGDVTALDMLDGIELYASACYDVTQMHLANIVTLTSVEEVKKYDHTAGYPEKLKF